MTAVYGTRFEIDLDRPSRSRPVNTAGPGQGPDAEPAKREEICHVYLEPFLRAHGLLDSVNAVGGLIVCTVGVVIFEIRRVELADYLPSLAVAPLITWLWK